MGKILEMVLRVEVALDEEDIKPIEEALLTDEYRRVVLEMLDIRDEELKELKVTVKENE